MGSAEERHEEQTERKWRRSKEESRDLEIRFRRSFGSVAQSTMDGWMNLRGPYKSLSHQRDYDNISEINSDPTGYEFLTGRF